MGGRRRRWEGEGELEGGGGAKLCEGMETCVGKRGRRGCSRGSQGRGATRCQSLQDTVEEESRKKSILRTCLCPYLLWRFAKMTGVHEMKTLFTVWH